MPVSDAIIIEFATRYRQQHYPKGVQISVLAAEILPKLLRQWPVDTLDAFPWSTNEKCFLRRLDSGLKARRTVEWLREQAICQLREPGNVELPVGQVYLPQGDFSLLEWFVGGRTANAYLVKAGEWNKVVAQKDRLEEQVQQLKQQLKECGGDRLEQLQQECEELRGPAAAWHIHQLEQADQPPAGPVGVKRVRDSKLTVSWCPAELSTSRARSCRTSLTSLPTYFSVACITSSTWSRCSLALDKPVIPGRMRS
jgi:hypothetical protein